MPKSARIKPSHKTMDAGTLLNSWYFILTPALRAYLLMLHARNTWCSMWNTRSIHPCRVRIYGKSFAFGWYVYRSAFTTHSDPFRMHVGLKLFYFLFFACTELCICNSASAPVELLFSLIGVCVCLPFMNFRSKLNCCIARVVRTTYNEISVEAAAATAAADDQLISLICEVCVFCMYVCPCQLRTVDAVRAGQPPRTKYAPRENRNNFFAADAQGIKWTMNVSRSVYLLLLPHYTRIARPILTRGVLLMHERVHSAISRRWQHTQLQPTQQTQDETRETGH